MTDAKPSKPRKIKPPRGTRDLYPAEAARRRWLMERWREVSIRHGFEEVNGPTYEDADLYAVKSGEGILGELFQAFSGKSPEEVERVKETGRAGYALRPEFTPTLARMYAAKANTLPKPCKWFMAGPFFRAERPQRGRLREFLQWNVDILGGDTVSDRGMFDADVIACCVDFLRAVGLSSDTVSVRVNHREVMASLFRAMGVIPSRVQDAFQLFDRRGKMPPEEFMRAAEDVGFARHSVDLFDVAYRKPRPLAEATGFLGTLYHQLGASNSDVTDLENTLSVLVRQLESLDLADWCVFDPSIVRGLAYYTGTVFEVIADGERSVAGGGRYDNLIELFGGPPTPAVGFAMGDVVLSLLLQDKGLMPSDDELLGLVGQHPDVFVLSNGSEEAEAKVRPVVAMLRRGEEREEGALSPTLSHDHSHGQAREREQDGLHVRHSYKATKKVDKLLAEAKKQHARFAVIIEDAESCVVKDLHTGEQWSESVALNELHTKLNEAL